MLEAGAVAALLAARHADPFAVLGLHTGDDGALWLRALLPGAEHVEVVDAGSGKRVAELAPRELAVSGGETLLTPLFEAKIPRRKTRFDYRLRVRWAHGGEGDYADAYAFPPQISEDELRAFHEGHHTRPQRFLGAHAHDIDGVSGVRFAVWAPNARRVSVVGDFNGWDGRRHPMRLRHTAGVWELYVPHAAPGDHYKYELVDANGSLLPAKADPYAFAAELRPGTASRVAAPRADTPLPPARAAHNHRGAPISTFEVHLASWGHPDLVAATAACPECAEHTARTGFPHWDALSAVLPGYVASLGFTHVELLPITEHPFDGSWGYQTLGLFAPTARFGEPEGFGRFVAACHAAGLGVILDWVPAHFPRDAHGLGRFDGTALYEYADPREGEHRDWGTLIPNFGRNEVVSFLTGSALHWLEHWGVDGLRVDAVASMLYRNYSREAGEWIPNAHGGRENLEAIALLQHINTTVGREAPGAIMLAEESTSFPGVSAPVHAGGLGFHFKWNMGWMNDTLRYLQEEPVHRRWHHDRMSFGLVYAFSENFMLPLSHDEVVHGKGSILGRCPGDEWQRVATLRAYYGFMWGHPGKKLLFMGQEFAQGTEWRDSEALPWHLLQYAHHAGVRNLVRDLNALYRDASALHALDCESAGFDWRVGDDRDQSVYAWARHDGAGDIALVACNFTPVPREGYRIPLRKDAPKAWREALNTDSQHYGGSDVGNGGGVLKAKDGALVLTLPPLATVVLRPA
jgi:1,4-alpha-glucan branching enzyme